MRLIDADALIDFIDLGHLRHPGELTFSELDVVNMLNHAPTTYDADKVVSNLEQLKLDGACNNEGCGYCKYRNECWDGDVSEEHAIDMAIEIVKRGGLDAS